MTRKEFLYTYVLVKQFSYPSDKYYMVTHFWIGLGNTLGKLLLSEESKITYLELNNAINNVSACSVLFLSTTGLFPARIKILEHEMQSSALTFF